MLKEVRALKHAVMTSDKSAKAAKRFLLRKFLRRVALWGGVPLAVGMLRLLRHTWRVGRSGEARFYSQRPVIVAFLHGDLLVGATGVMASRRKDFATLASRSRDGEIAALLARLVNITPLRGGASRGQVEALRAMERWLLSGKSLLVAVDGPRGPRGIVKNGVILLASRTGIPIVPAGCRVAPDQAWVFRSWDRMLLPKPGAKIQVLYGEPIAVPSGLSREELEQYRVQVEKALSSINAEELSVSS